MSQLRIQLDRVLVNGSPTLEFQFHKGLFSGIPIDQSLTLSHLFFTDDAIFVVLKLLESIRRKNFNGVKGLERKMAWISWNKVLASKKYGGLGVSSFYALNRALLFK
ncbi:hypothetical protein Tco_0595550 [Tanacetum coccineum]